MLVCGMQRILFSFSWVLMSCCCCGHTYSTLVPPVQHTPSCTHTPAFVQMLQERFPSLSELHESICPRGVDAREVDREVRRFWYAEVSSLAKVCMPMTYMQTRVFKNTDCADYEKTENKWKGKEKGGAGGGIALTCGAASTSGNHVRE